ncbi:LuxR family transcriptional regulator [Mycolicibacterium frederiksbergense]
MIEASPRVDESSAVEELLAAHAEMESLTIALADARERRRAAARRLLELGRGFPWIAAQLGVTPQAVDGFVKYKDRNQRT